MNPSTRTCLSQLISLASQDIYLVGGSVRDLIIGREDIKDIDVLMQADSEAIARTLADRINGSFFFLDETRKISRVVKRDDQEVIQFDFTNFEGPDLQADLSRRDFTINAMALDLRVFVAKQTVDGLIDPFSGKEDIQRRIIRVVRPEVLDEDPLRLLRAVRFAATLNFSIDKSSAEHIRQRSALMGESSPERIRDEFFLILTEEDAEKNIMLLDSLGLLTTILPELEPLRGFAPGRYHVHDVLTHSIKTAGYIESVLDELQDTSPSHAGSVRCHLQENLEHLVPRIAALRFACLLHDMAKPDTFTDANGRIRFHGHDNLGAEKAVSLCRRLRLSRNTEALVSGLIKSHMRLFNLAAPGGPSKNAMYRYCRDLGDALPESLLLAQADARGTFELMPREKFIDTRNVMTAVLDYYYAKFRKTDASPLVNGNDLIRLGLMPGPRFGEILDEMKERQAEGMVRNRQEALEYLERLT